MQYNEFSQSLLQQTNYKYNYIIVRKTTYTNTTTNIQSFRFQQINIRVSITHKVIIIDKNA